MSMKGSPINWWKEKRQSSHPSIPTRPQTAFPFPTPAETAAAELSKQISQAVISAFESSAFKIAIAAEVDPAFSRHSEKLAQIKTANLNLESLLQAHVEDLPVLLRGISNHVTGLESKIPDYGEEFERLGRRNEELERKIEGTVIPDNTEQLNGIIAAQAKFLKSFESRFSALESRIEDLDRKTSDLNEEVTNADLRSAIRFGEISNELQDRNTTLNNSIWDVQRELGKKTDALQRRVVGACEEVGKIVKGQSEVLEAIRTKGEEGDLLSAVEKMGSKADFAEKATRRSLTAIQEKVSGLDTSSLATHTSKLESIERGMGEFRKEAEAARNLASVSSKFLSANTTKIDSMATAVGKMHLLVEATNEICQEVSESQENHAESIKEDVESVKMHVRSLDGLAVTHARRLSEANAGIVRTESAAGKIHKAVTEGFGMVGEKFDGVEETLKVLPECKTKLDGLEGSIAGMAKDAKPQKKVLDNLRSTLEEMRGNVDTALSSHIESLSSIHRTMSGTVSKDSLSTAISGLQSSIETRISSSHETTSKSTNDAISDLQTNVESALSSHTKTLSEAVTKTASEDGISTALATLQATIENKISSSHETTAKSTTDAISVLHTNIQTSLSSHTESLSKAVSSTASQDSLATALSDLQSGLEGKISASHEITSKSTISAITTELGALSSSFESRFLSQKEDIKQEFTSTRTAIETSQSSHIESAKVIRASVQEMQESSKDDEILLQIESWAQNCIAKQAAEIASLREVVELSHTQAKDYHQSLTSLSGKHEELSTFLHSGGMESSRTIQELGLIKEMLENEQKWAELKGIAKATEEKIAGMQVSVQEIRNDTTLTSIKDLVMQNVSTLTTVGEGISAIDTQLKNSETNVLASMEKVHSELGTEIRTSSTATSAEMADLKTDISSRVSTSTNILRSEIQTIDLSPITSSLEGLKSDIENLGIKEVGNAVKRVEEHVQGAGIARNEILSAVKTNGADLARVSEVLTRVEDGSVQNFEGVKTEITNVGGGIAKAHSELENSLKTDFQSVKDSVYSGAEDVKTAVSEASKLNVEAHTSTYAALGTEGKWVREAIVAESQKTGSNYSTELESTRKAIIDEVAQSKTTLENAVDSVKSDIQNVTSELSGTKNEIQQSIGGVQLTVVESKKVLDKLTTEHDKSSAGAAKIHRETIEAVTASSQATQDIIVSGNGEAQVARTSLHESTIASILSAIGTEKSSLLADLEVVKSSIQESRNALEAFSSKSMSRFNDATAEAGKTRDDVLSTLGAENEALLKTLKSEVLSVSVAIEAARGKLTDETSKGWTLLDQNLGTVEKSLLARLNGVETDLAKQVEITSKAVTESSKNLATDIKAGFSETGDKHERTLKAIKDESKSLSEIVISQSKETKDAITAARDTTTSKIQDSRTSLSEELVSIEKKLQTNLNTVDANASKRSDDTASISEKQHKLATETLKTTLVETVKAMQKVNADGVDRLSKDITNGFEGTSADHTTTIEALEHQLKSIKAYIDEATEHSASATQELLNPMQENQRALENLQKLASETQTSFKVAADARKKTDGLVEMVAKDIRTQGKTMSTSFEQVQGGVRDMGASLEASVERSVTKEGETIRECVNTRSDSMDGKIAGLMDTVREEGKTMRKSTEKVSAGIETNTAKLERKLDAGFSNLSTENKTSSKTLDTHISTLSSAIKDEAETTQARVETLHSRVLDEVQKTDTALRSSLSSLRTTLDRNQESSTKTHSNILSTIQTLSTTLSQANTAIENLPPSLKAIDVAVRVNSAAIARVDKAVLESSSQVKAEINSSLNSLSAQLDDELQDTSRRVRGIAEYEIPRLEALAKKQRDMVEVIGGRIIGTTKRFDEMVANVGKGSTNGLEKSELLGMSGRLRNGSNASSTRSKDSGYRMGAFENGGRM